MADAKDPKAAAKDTDADPGISNADVLTKYKTAGEMANRIVKLVATECKEGAFIVALCKLGDETIVADTSKVFNKKVDGKDIEKGMYIKILFLYCIF